VLTTYPAFGVARHPDAGYEIATRTAAAHDIRLPMREG
jgi:urocanate hydratase